MSFVSYAQNFEDVMLARCFPGPHGFYVDVGANDPDVDSVTRAFYERGWSGINIEPLKANFTRLQKRRPRDMNLRLAAGDSEGTITFYEVGKWHGYSTTNSEIAAQHRRDKLKVVERRLPVRPLAEILDEHARGRTIDFLSVDVEGAEMAVFAGAGLDRHRPRVIVAESRMPVTVNMVDRFFEVPDRAAEYAEFLARYDYRLVYEDGLNAFCVAREHAELARHFRYPPGVADRIVHAASRRPLEKKLEKLRTELAGLRTRQRPPGPRRHTRTAAVRHPARPKRRK